MTITSIFSNSSISILGSVTIGVLCMIIFLLHSNSLGVKSKKLNNNDQIPRVCWGK